MMKTFVLILAMTFGLMVKANAQELGPIKQITAPQFQACQTVEQAVNQIEAFEAGNGKASLVEGCGGFRADPMMMMMVGGVPLTVEPIAVLIYETRTWEVTKVTVMVDGTELFSWAVVEDEPEDERA